MEPLLSFLSNLILFTAGLVVVIFWIIALVIIAIEIWDLISGRWKGNDDA